ncbi:expressed unknown protein [Seminavis robusta]|uniref:U-box domain-containing protein n=1 Tax=Seminavis robusta TaxID=568900 RepID=A0A9N8HSJ4_9STRA|nr:expressed unknown protein [Seminavis robusta]|eukprot:Sro1531_g280130.1 n/a (121) ;mRNA; f:1703-2065
MTEDTNEATATESVDNPDAVEQGEEETKGKRAKTDGERGGETRQPAKKKQRTEKSFADDLICCISHELPWVPVTAMDGRVYERKCIEAYMERNPHDLKSPVTRQPMGPDALAGHPAPQHD